MSKLSTLKIKSLTKVGMHSDGNGLHLKIQLSKQTNTLNKSWIFRWGAQGKNTMGLGAYPIVSLATAREKTLECKRSVANGLNPRDERDKVKIELKAAKAHSVTFEKAAKEYIKTHRESWKNVKHAQQWESTLDTYAFKKIGKVPCADVTKEQVLSILTPIWTEKHETATRLRGRIEKILDWAMAKGYRTATNSAVLKGNLQPLLPTINKRKRIEHHKALHYDDVPTLFTSIKEDPSTSARALVFCILTATRTTETTDAQWAEFNLEKSIWIVPKERMKRDIEHRVPLPTQLIEILRNMNKSKSRYVFHGAHKNSKPISNMTMLKYLQRKKGYEKITVHGFRSSFRDWAAEKGNFPREVCEQALAHSLADQTEAAYQRADYFDKRMVLMQAWSDYCFGVNANVASAETLNVETIKNE
jgi:integrase